MRRISLRSPLAWRAFSGAGLDLPGGGCLAGRCSPLGGILGAAFRGGGVGWFAGGGTPWSTTAPEPETIGGDRCRSSQSTESGRHGRQSMGRQDLGRMDRTTVWSPPGGGGARRSDGRPRGRVASRPAGLGTQITTLPSTPLRCVLGYLLPPRGAGLDC